jgi:hypothetical protein
LINNIGATYLEKGELPMKRRPGRPQKVPTEPIELEGFRAKEEAKRLAREKMIAMLKSVEDEQD